jgi:dTDP-4-amino-4,6-dideoxygalactose transaminase
MDQVFDFIMNESKHDGRNLPNSDMYTDRLLRLPLYYELTEKNVIKIAKELKKLRKEKLLRRMRLCGSIAPMPTN